MKNGKIAAMAEKGKVLHNRGAEMGTDKGGKKNQQ